MVHAWKRWKEFLEEEWREVLKKNVDEKPKFDTFLENLNHLLKQLNNSKIEKNLKTLINDEKVQKTTAQEVLTLAYLPRHQTPAL